MTPCPACGGTEVREVARTRPQPVNSCLLVFSEAASRAVPRAPILLAGCGTCGFLWNAAFDAEAVRYGPDYEGTQIHSPTFRAYLDRLAADWLSGLDAVGPVLEVGCGQGEFLERIAARTGSRVVGYDPAFRGNPPPGVEIRAEVLPPAGAERFDLVLCRMTLEHLPDPMAVLRRMAGWLAPGGTLVTQVPNAARMVEGRLACDLVYEHVNHFDARSLTALHRRAGLGDVALQIDYEGQHLTAFARIGGDTGGAVGTAHGDLEGFGAAVAGFGPGWSRRIADWTAAGRRIAVWGTGSRATAFCAALDDPSAISAAIDINPNRQGSFVLGTGIATFTPDALSRIAPDVVIGMNPVYREEIAAELARHCPAATLVFVGEDGPRAGLDAAAMQSS